MNQAAIYPVLRSLEKQQLLRSRMVPSESGPPRKYYNLLRPESAGRPMEVCLDEDDIICEFHVGDERC